MPDRSELHQLGGGVPVRLRPHHLLCILTFAGAGYSDAFVQNLRTLVERIGRGTPVELITGPDDICAKLQTAPEAQHCLTASVALRDAAALSALSLIAGWADAIAGGAQIVLDAARLSDIRARFAAGDIRAACAGCEWAPLCTVIADDNFAAALLRPA